MNIFRESYGKAELSIQQILTDPVLFLAFGFGSGLSRKAAGTCGTVAALPVYYGLAQSGFLIYSIATVLSVLAGIYFCDYAAHKLKEHDYGGIVWDEVAGYLVTMWFVPTSWQAMLAGFVLFRLFDITKPQPIKWIDQRVQGGFGIMLDDIIAGLFAGAIVYGLVSYSIIL